MSGDAVAPRSPDVVPFAVGTAVLAAALLAGPLMGGAVHGVRQVVAAAAVAALALAYGRLLSPLLALPRRVPAYLVEIIVGYGAASVVHLTATATLSLGAWPVLAVDMLGVALLSLGRRRPPPEQDDAPSMSGTVACLALLACAALAVFWAREAVGAVVTARQTGLFPAWQDYFLHAAEVSYLRDYPSYAGQSQYLTAVPQPLYHRGTFALAALLSALGDVPSLLAATAYWLPVGLFLCLCGTFAWGAAMAGIIGGIGAVAAVFLVPDASSYWFENRYLSFHWLMQMAGGSGYAMSLVLVALSSVVCRRPGREGRAFAVAVVLVAAGAAFRVHVALLAAALFAWYLVLAWRPRVSARGLGAIVLAAALASAAVVWMEAVSLAPHFLSGRSHPVLFFLSVHTQANDLPSWFRVWREGHGDAAQVVVGFALMMLAGCGASVAGIAAVWATGVFRRMGTRVASLPVAIMLASLSVILIVPTPAHGDITDFGHRPFVLVYLIFGALTGAGAARLLGDWSARRLGRNGPATWLVTALAAVGLVVPWQDGARIQQRWVARYAMMPVRLEAFLAADYVRAHSRPGDQILASGEDPDAFLVAATERRAYLSRTSLYRLLGGDYARAADDRAGRHARLAAPDSFEALRAFGRAEGIAWYFADRPSTYAWPDAVTSHCAYCGAEVRVYDLR
jgi:hypothetical protein